MARIDTFLELLVKQEGKTKRRGTEYDGEQVFSAQVGGPEDHAQNSADFLASRVAIDARMTSPRLPITARNELCSMSFWRPPPSTLRRPIRRLIGISLAEPPHQVFNIDCDRNGLAQVRL